MPKNSEHNETDKTPKMRAGAAGASGQTHSTVTNMGRPDKFLFEGGILPENQRLGYHLRAHGISIDWTTRNGLRSGRHQLTPATLVAGSVQYVHTALEMLGVDIPAPLGFPETLTPWLHRNIEHTTAAAAIERASGQLIFAKPADQLKAFTGGLTNDIEVIDALRTLEPERHVYISDVVEMLAEWRCFVIDGQLRAVEQYAPDIDVCLWPKPTPEELEPLIDAAHNATGYASMSVDVARGPGGELIVVELNDGYALGSYGIDNDTYYDLLWSRWQQLTTLAVTETDCD